MAQAMTESEMRRFIGEVHRQESTRVLATLVRVVGDLDLAEDAMQDAFTAALKQWIKEGVPVNPRAWLITAGRFKAIDALRKNNRNAELTDSAMPVCISAPLLDDNTIEDDRLRLIFICCHPALPNEAQIALTLREVCGLTTEEIAHAFLTSAPTVAQRIVRAKSRIREAKIPYELPEGELLPERLQSVLKVAYLVFNEGYYASSGYSLTRPSLASEAIRLARLVVELLPDPEVFGLLGLMLLQESRRSARSTATGDLILLSDQNRELWNHSMIDEGLKFVGLAMAARHPGAYAFQAAIAAVHASSKSSEETDWNKVVGLYDRLVGPHASPVAALNRAVAVAMRDGPEAGIQLIDEVMSTGTLDDYGLAHSARADLCRRCGRTAEARDSYLRALNLATQDAERRFLNRRMEELSSGQSPRP